MIRVELNEVEIRIVKFIARERTSANTRAGTPNKQFDPNRKREDLDIVGFGGEMAFGKEANCYPDFSIIPRAGGHDFWYQDNKVDVKTTDYDGPTLKMMTGLWKGKHNEDDLPDLYVLIQKHVDSFIFDIIGFCRKEELLNPENIGDKGHGDCYILDASRLKDPLDLFC